MSESFGSIAQKNEKLCAIKLQFLQQKPQRCEIKTSRLHLKKHKLKFFTFRNFL